MTDRVRRIVVLVVASALCAAGMVASYAAPGTSHTATAIVPRAVRLRVSPAVTRIAYGTGVQLRATGAGGNTRWATGNRSLAKVSRAGLVTATTHRRAGTVRITAKSGGVTARATVKVSTATLQSISGVPASAVLVAGGQLTLAPLGHFQGFTEALAPWASYASSSPTVASASRGVLTATSVGTTTVRATFHGVTASIVVTVVPPGTVIPGATSLTVRTATPTFTDADSDGILDMGDVLHWSNTISNSGATTVRGVSATGSLSGAASCAATTLAPGASTTCAAQHTVTTAEVANGSLTDTITASGTGTIGAVSSAPASVTSSFDRMDVALQHGLPNLVTYSELVSKATTLAAGHVNLAQTLLPSSPMNWQFSDQGQSVSGYAVPFQQVVLRSNHNFNGGGSTADLAVAGTAPGQSTRMAYLASNPFTNLLASPRTATTDPGLNGFSVNLLKWLLKASDLSSTPFNVKLVNTWGSTTSGTEGPTRQWFAAHAPGLHLNTTECDLPATTCLTGADLVVFGGTGSTADSTTIADQVKAACDAGVPVLFMADNNFGDAPAAIAQRFGMAVDWSPIYWDHDGLLSSTSADQLPGGLDAFQQVVNPLVNTTFGTPLATGDYSACIGHADVLVSCSLGTAAFNTYRAAVSAWQGLVSAADQSGTSWFTQPRTSDQDLMRALVMLADKLRTGAAPSLRPGDSVPAVTYPVPTTTDAAATGRALFVDATTMTAWAGNQAAADTGTVYCSRASTVAHACTAPSWPGFGNHSLTLKATQNDEWQATGFDAKPGVPVTVSLTSDPGVKVYVRTFFQRSGTTKSGLLDGSSRSYFDRPQYLATDWIPVTTTPTTLSSPYGGPLYIRIAGSGATAGTSVPLSFTNAATHPTVLDMTSDAQVAAFVSSIDDGAYYADLGGSGFEAHMPITAIKDALANSGTAGRTWSYNAHGGLQQFLDDFRDQYVFTIYKMAGLQFGPTTPLAASDDPDVVTACQNLGFPCLDPTLNQRTVIQHVNYDQHAQCGDLCSGNPIDSDGSPSPAGWGENHELGHNLQRQQLNVAWVDTSTGLSAVNSWTNYQNRSQEVSNNIFPYHAAWNFYRNVHQGWGLASPTSPDTGALGGGIGDLNAFSIAQSIRSAQSTGGHLAAYDASCVSHTTDPLSTPTNIAIADAFWKDGGYAADEDLRLSFYFDIALLMRGKTLADSGSTVLHDGWGIWTLLYQAARGWSAATASSSTWTPAAQSTYGMSDFAWNNDAVYGSGNTVASMVGNDWLLIELSKITGYDWRPYFQLHGVLYTAQAGQQVVDNTPAGGYKSWNMTFPALGGQYPFADDSNIGTVDMTLPNAAWPGAYENSSTVPSHVGFTPASCP